MQTDDFFPPCPASRSAIYAFADTNPQYAGMLKVGYTTVDVQSPVAQQYPTLRPGKRPYRIVLEAPAMRNDGSVFTDHEVHRMLRLNGIKREAGEWFRCTVDDVKTAAIAACTGQLNEESRSLDFQTRPEQEAAVLKNAACFRSFRKDKRDKPPCPQSRMTRSRHPRARSQSTRNLKPPVVVRTNSVVRRATPVAAGRPRNKSTAPKNTARQSTEKGSIHDTVPVSRVRRAGSTL